MYIYLLDFNIWKTFQEMTLYKLIDINFVVKFLCYVMIFSGRSKEDGVLWIRN